MKSLKETCTLLEDRKIAILFKVTNVIAKLGNPPMIQVSTLIFPNELEVEVSKPKDKWVREFDNLMVFFEDNIRSWTVDYTNLGKNIYVTVWES